MATGTRIPVNKDNGPNVQAIAGIQPGYAVPSVPLSVRPGTLFVLSLREMRN